MFKIFGKKNKEQIDYLIETEIDKDALQRARYRLIGASVLFFTVLLFLPFIVKKPEQRTKDLQLQLINDSESTLQKHKFFKKIKPKTTNKEIET